MAVAAAYIAYTVGQATGSYWLGPRAAIVAGLLLGVVVERRRDAPRRRTPRR